jgi:hypothetical protein
MQKFKQHRTKRRVLTYRNQATSFEGEKAMAAPANRHEWTYKLSACACALFLLFDLLTL